MTADAGAEATPEQNMQPTDKNEKKGLHFGKSVGVNAEVKSGNTGSLLRQGLEGVEEERPTEMPHVEKNPQKRPDTKVECAKMGLTTKGVQPSAVGEGCEKNVRNAEVNTASAKRVPPRTTNQNPAKEQSLCKTGDRNLATALAEGTNASKNERARRASGAVRVTEKVPKDSAEAVFANPEKFGKIQVDQEKLSVSIWLTMRSTALTSEELSYMRQRLKET